MVTDLGSFDLLDYGNLHNQPVVDPWSVQAYLYMSEKVMLREHADPLFHDGIITAFVRNAFTLAHSSRIRRRRAERLAPKELAVTLDYICTNYGTALSLQELAGLSGYSKYHFLRAFSNTVGKTPYQFVLRERVKRAAELLCNTEISISDIADITGFADQAHLTRQVHRLIGQTPGKLRGVKFVTAISKEKNMAVN
jgi:transcriptional regulator GlxA family with amidase domain